MPEGLSTTRTPLRDIRTWGPPSGGPSGPAKAGPPRLTALAHSSRSSGAVDGIHQLLFEQRSQVREVSRGPAARRVGVAAAAEFAGDGVHVHVALRAHADPPVAGPALLEEDDRLDLLHRERKVDEPLGVVVGG